MEDITLTTDPIILVTTTIKGIITITRGRKKTGGKADLMGISPITITTKTITTSVLSPCPALCRAITIMTIRIIHQDGMANTGQGQMIALGLTTTIPTTGAGKATMTSQDLGLNLWSPTIPPQLYHEAKQTPDGEAIIRIMATAQQIWAAGKAVLTNPHPDLSLPKLNMIFDKIQHQEMTVLQLNLDMPYLLRLV